VSIAPGAAPDYVEPVLGWRLWYAVGDGADTQLSSVVHRTLWPRGAPLEASCRRMRLSFWPFSCSRHDAPAEDCTCGIYAASVGALETYLPEVSAWTYLVPVLGRVSLWGVVHQHEHGWRASRAYPESLFVPIAELRLSRAVQVVSGLRAYGVPVRAVDGSSADAVVAEVSALAA
jgi:hypothetical protein